MKSTIAAGILFLILFTGCTFNVQEQSKEITLLHSSVGLTKVSIHEELLEENSVSVQGIEGKVIIVSTYASMLTLKDDDDELNGLSLLIDRNGEISYTYPGTNWSCIEIGKISVDLDKTIDLKLKSRSEDIKVMDMKSFLDLETVSGNCNIETSEGCKVETTSGDVKLSVEYDPLVVTTSLYMKTTSGDVDIFLPNDTLAYTTTTGRITVKTTGGDVTITIPEGFTANLNFSTTSGDREVTPSFNNNSASSNSIKCTTTSGDLTIKTYSK